MPKDLYLIDVSPFLYAGKVIKYAFFEQLVDRGATWSSQRTPAGGISFLLNTVQSIYGKGDVVFCCDRNPTIKKDMHADYKNNRKHDSRVEIEKGVAEYILETCGCNIFARAGYEADDLIYTFVKKCYNFYDRIFIYTGDSDLYFLVDKKVTVRPASSKGKTVSIDNYEQISLKGHNYRYNTITLNKILAGDTSDNIPALPSSVSQKIVNFLCNDAIYKHLGDKDLLMYYAQLAFPEAIDQINLVFPLTVDDLPTDFKKPDWELLWCFGNAMHNVNFRNYDKPGFDVEPYVSEMQSRGLYIEEVN